MTGKALICFDGPDSYGYMGHECQRKGCRRHYRADHKQSDHDAANARTGGCTRCDCPGFEDLP